MSTLIANLLPTDSASYFEADRAPKRPAHERLRRGGEQEVTRGARYTPLYLPDAPRHARLPRNPRRPLHAGSFISDERPFDLGGPLKHRTSVNALSIAMHAPRPMF